MKRTLSMITLAAFALMLLGSCAKINERLDSLEKKVDGIENEEIASIESQVESIESSISDLKSIRDKVQAMSDPATGLSKRIEDLKAFVSDVKKDYATKDWAKTTLVTMAEYEKTCDTVAKIALKVEGFDSSLKACADSLKGWVNVKFGGYYDIAEIDAKLAELQAQVDGVDSLSAELAKTREEIDTAKAAIRAEYRAAITSAIETSEGKLTQALQDSIDNVNATIVTLTGRVGILETKVEALKGRVDSLENMIQTVTIIPAYSDGSVKVEDDTLSIDCIISPAEVVKALDPADFTILLNRVLTRAIVLDTVPADSIKVLTKNTLTGTVSIKANIAGFIPEGDTSLTVAINVSKDKSDCTTEFIPVAISVLPINEQFVNGTWFITKDNISAAAQPYFNMAERGSAEEGEQILCMGLGPGSWVPNRGYSSEWGLFFASGGYAGQLIMNTTLVGEDKVKIEFALKGQGDGIYYYNNCNYNYIVGVICQVAGDSYIITTDNVKNPSYLKLTNEQNSDIWITVLPEFARYTSAE